MNVRRAREVVLVIACLLSLGARASAAAVDVTRERNLQLLDSVVFVLGVTILGGVLVYCGRRIFLEK